jgi:hypothetical protein
MMLKTMERGYFMVKTDKLAVLPALTSLNYYPLTDKRSSKERS